MKGLCCVMLIAASVVVAVSVPAAPGPKVIEIDASGNISTTSGMDTDRAKRQVTAGNPASGRVARDGNARMSICDPRYRWSPSGLSSDTVARARAFYRDFTRPYERDTLIARRQGTRLSRAREIEYWDGLIRFLRTVPRNHKDVVERGVTPRVDCGAPPLIQTPVEPPRPLRQ